MLKNKDEKISKGSLKEVALICDYCGDECLLAQRTRFKSRKIIEKDACKNCRSEKRKESCLKKYGHEVASKAREVKQKQSKTGLVVEDFKDKILEMHSSNESVNNIALEINITRSVLIRYMKELGLDTKGDPVAKAKATNLDKYGNENYLQSDKGKAVIKQAMIDKYGSENPYDNEDYKKACWEKSKKTSLARYGVEMNLQDPTKQKEFNDKRRETRIKNGNEIVWDGKSAKELCEEIGINLSSFHERVRKVGLERAVSTEKHQTYIEAIIKKVLEDNNIEFEDQYYVDGKMADFFIPSHNVVIECDGLYWHSDAVINDKNYHKNKRELYISKGYSPLFFYEDEINNKLDIVESIIMNKLGKSTKIFGRKTEAIKGGSREFFEENHLMGKGYGEIYSLNYCGETVAAMQIRRLRSDEYEVSRFCCKKGVSVIGGFSKLLSLVEKSERTLKIGTLKTFIDLRYGAGEYLEDFGFKKGNGHLSFFWTNGKDRIHRLKFRSNSGYKNGLAKIWDCGQLPFIKYYS